MIDTTKVTRVEVINHASCEGRVYTYWCKDDDGVNVELSIQDDGRTLKIFIIDQAATED